MKLSWWKRQVLLLLLRHWRKAHRKQTAAAAKLMTYASQFGQLDWAIRCVHSDPNAFWTQDHNGLSSPVSHSKTAAPIVPPIFPAAPFTSARTQSSFFDAIPTSVAGKDSNPLSTSEGMRTPFEGALLKPGADVTPSADVCTADLATQAADENSTTAANTPAQDAANLAHQAVHYLLRRIQRDARLAYYFADTESLERLITAHATAFGLEVNQFRQMYLADLQSEAPTCHSCGDER